MMSEFTCNSQSPFIWEKTLPH